MSWLTDNPFLRLGKPGRTPNFVDETLYEDEPGPPPPMADSAPPPIQKIATKRLPEMPVDSRPGGVKGALREVAGRIVGRVAPEAGERIAQGDYPSKMREYGRKAGQIKAETDIDADVARAEASRAAAGASVFTGRAAEARRKAEEARAGSFGQKPMLVNKNQRVLDPITKQVILESEKEPDEMIEIDPAAGQRLGLPVGSDGKIRIPKQAITGYFQANKPPEDPAEVRAIRTEVTGSNPGLTKEQVDAKVAEALGAERKGKGDLRGSQIERNRRLPAGKPVVPVTPATSDLSATAKAVKASPLLFDNLTPTKKAAVIEDLQVHGDLETLAEVQGRPLPEKSANQVSKSRAAIVSLQELGKKLKNSEKYTGPIGSLQAINPWSDAKKIKADVDLMRQGVGKALEEGVLRKEDELKYKEILATIGDDPSTAQHKIDGVKADFLTKIDQYIDAMKRSGFRTRSLSEGGGAPPPPPTDVVRMLGPDGKVKRVRPEHIEAAKAEGYKVVN